MTPQHEGAVERVRAWLVSADISTAQFAPDLRLIIDTLTEALAERDEARKKLELARDAFLNMIADATRWDEDWDGDADEYGRPITYLNYHLTTNYSQLDELVDALGISRAYDETSGQAIERAIATDVVAS